jgi:5-hydroxyisourate hydrolase-like protein (transthyretin family)
MPNASIHGLVINAATRRPLAGVRVEAWDKDRVAGDLLGAAVTDDQGNFSIELDARVYKTIVDRRADVYFRVLLKQQVLADTRRQVVWNVREPGLRVVIAVPNLDGPHDPGGPGPRPHRDPVQVDGQVSTTAGVPVVDVRVEVRVVQLAGDKVVATGVTDDKGRYSLRTDPALSDAGAPDLQVRVLDPRQQNAEIARSAVIYDAVSPVVIDLRVAAADVKRPSEYERLIAAVQSVVLGKALGDLDARGADYVANRVGGTHGPWRWRCRRPS